MRFPRFLRDRTEDKAETSGTDFVKNLHTSQAVRGGGGNGKGVTNGGALLEEQDTAQGDDL